MPFAASILVTAKATAINLLASFGSATGFAFVFGAMQIARTVQATALVDFFREIRIDFFEQGM